MTATESFVKVQALLKTLRSDKGCPWDRSQTLSSLAPLFLEEAYELCEQLRENPHCEDLSEELGDVLLHIIFISEIASEQGLFCLDDVIKKLNKKIIQRHPHVFGISKTASIASIKKNWEAIKQTKENKEPFSGIPKALPALKKAQKIQVSASRLGIVNQDTQAALEKIENYIKDLKTQAPEHSPQNMSQVLASLLFECVHLIQSYSLDAESICQENNERQKKRFIQAIQTAKSRNIDLQKASKEELASIWQTLTL